MKNAAQLRLCVVGPSGSGKSSVVAALRRALKTGGRRVEVIKLAQPLYRLQSEFYATAGRAIDAGVQDQALLEAIATHLRRIDPAALVHDFERRLADCAADAVLNDDLRDDVTDAPRLRALGFRTLRVVTAEPVRLARLAARGDLTSVAQSPLDRQIARLPVDYVLDNSAEGLAGLDRKVDTLARHLLTEETAPCPA